AEGLLVPAPAALVGSPGPLHAAQQPDGSGAAGARQQAAARDPDHLAHAADSALPRRNPPPAFRWTSPIRRRRPGRPPPTEANRPRGPLAQLIDEGAHHPKPLRSRAGAVHVHAAIAADLDHALVGGLERPQSRARLGGDRKSVV